MILKRATPKDLSKLMEIKGMKRAVHEGIADISIK